MCYIDTIHCVFLKKKYTILGTPAKKTKNIYECKGCGSATEEVELVQILVVKLQVVIILVVKILRKKRCCISTMQRSTAEEVVLGSCSGCTTSIQPRHLIKAENLLLARGS